MVSRAIKIALIVFIITFSLYSLTLPEFNPSVADSDELITVAHIWGVAHPPGYPLHTVLAGVFGRLPLPFFDFAGQVNLLSAFLQSMTVGVFFLCSYFLFDRFFKNTQVIKYASILGSFLLAFAYSFWFHGLIAEVFPLNSFLNSLVILFLILWERGIKNSEFRVRSSDELRRSKQSLRQSLKLTGYPTASSSLNHSSSQQATRYIGSKNRYLALAALFYGLSLSNQQASLLLSPAYLFWVLVFGRKEISNWGLLVKLFGLGLIGFLIPYIYVLIAASRQPFLNWENVNDFTSLYRLITRAVYSEASSEGQAYLATGQLRLGQIFIQTVQYINYLRNNFSLLPFLFGLGGIIGLFRLKERRLLIFLFLGLIGSGLFFAIWDPIDFGNLGNPDFATAVLIMRRFYTFSLFFYGLFITFGIALLLDYLFEKKKNYYKKGISLLIVLTVILGLASFNNIRQNDFDLAHDYSKTFLGSLDKNSLLICITAENGCFQSYYLQQVEGFRTDVVVIPGDFKQRSLSQLKSQTPSLFKTTSTDQVPLIRDIIRQNIDKRSIYIMGLNPTVEWLSVLNVDGNPFYVRSEGCGVLKVTKTFDEKSKIDNCQELEDRVISQIETPTNFYKDIYSDIFSADRYFNSVIFLTHDCVDQSKKDLERSLLLNPNLSLSQTQLQKITKDAPKDTKCPFQKEQVTTESINDKLIAVEAEKATDIAQVQDIKQQKIYLTYQLTMLEPDNIEYRLKLADLLANSGFFNLARLEYQDVLVLDANNESAIKSLSELEQRI